MSPEEIDRMVTASWSRPLRPMLVEIEPFHTLIMDLFKIHAGEHAGFAWRNGVCNLRLTSVV